MKIVKILLLSLILLLVTACGNRVPFKEQAPLENAALVYVYVVEDITSSEDTQVSNYSIRINNKRYLERITEGEYLAFNLKPLTIDISATRGQVEEHKESVTLEAGKIYYFKIDKLDGGDFSFERVSLAIGSKEITKTGLAGSMVEDESNIITEFVNPKEDEDVHVKAVAPVQSRPQTVAPVAVPVSTTASVTPKRVTASKMDEIREAYDMKKEGILSDEEFKALKAEILAK
ncbi:MAG: DUF2846 domain-containing protein [Campylobacterota bacterium]|nr:DUF2846 domain-containing protein [Campylobacterota bacterium]